jgi:hypothetical protein
VTPSSQTLLNPEALRPADRAPVATEDMLRATAAGRICGVAGRMSDGLAGLVRAEIGTWS